MDLEHYSDLKIWSLSLGFNWFLDKWKTTVTQTWLAVHGTVFSCLQFTE